jgi:cell division protein FtsB
VIGNRDQGELVFTIMRTLDRIREDIDRLSDRRADVLQRLSAGHNAELAAEHQRLEDEIASLWDEQRHTRAMIRFGDRDTIIQRARHDERLSRAA